MTEELFRDDAYAKSCEAEVVAINDRGGIILDRTVFYATGGGQPGDAGRLVPDSGPAVPIATTVYEQDRSGIVHVPADGSAALAPGQKVHAEIDWQKRHGHMRVHTCLHLLCALLPYPVTGGQIGTDQGRLDFDIPEAGLDKQELTERLIALIEADHAVASKWISDEELARQPDLVRTMAVKPPMGSGRVRLIEIANTDLQPCGGTHVRSTVEIGPAEVSKIEKKGAQNRRVRIALGSAAQA